MRPQIHNTFCICICIYVYICICICICISLRPGCLFDLNCGNCCGREHPPLLRPTVTANLRSAAQASWQIYLKIGQEYIAHFGRNTFRLKQTNLFQYFPFYWARPWQQISGQPHKRHDKYVLELERNRFLISKEIFFEIGNKSSVLPRTGGQ